MTQPLNSTFPSLSCAAYNEQNIPMEPEALQDPAEEAAMERPPVTPSPASSSRLLTEHIAFLNNSLSPFKSAGYSFV